MSDSQHNLENEGKKIRQAVTAFAKKFNLEEASVIPLLKEISFAEADPSAVRVADILAFLLAIEKYDLDPFMREIYAIKNDYGYYMPVVGVDGWNKIIIRQEKLGCIQFKYSPDLTTVDMSQSCSQWIECEIYLKDYHLPTVVREYLAGNYRNTKWWNNNTTRQLRHKALIQCARVAFGLSGIADADEVQGNANKLVSKTAHNDKVATDVKSDTKQNPLTGGLKAAREEIEQVDGNSAPSMDGPTAVVFDCCGKGVGEKLFEEV